MQDLALPAEILETNGNPVETIFIFTEWVIDVWNSLPGHVVEATHVVKYTEKYLNTNTNTFQKIKYK